MSQSHLLLLLSFEFHTIPSLPTPASNPWPTFLLGMRLFFPVAVSIASYGVVWGVLAGQAGLSPLEVV